MISDIHGNLPYLRALLDKLELTEEDTLVFCGDMVEKGPQSLDTLRYIMDLSKKRRVLAVQGNCDCWQEEIYRPQGYSDGYLRRYLASNGAGWGPGLLAQMCAEIGFPLTPEPDIAAMRPALAAAFPPRSSTSSTRCPTSWRRSTTPSPTAACRRVTPPAGTAGTA